MKNEFNRQRAARFAIAGILMFSLLLAFSLPAKAETIRSYKARADFARAHPCPATDRRSPSKCPGYVIDHVVPLCANGADAPQNMQWQTIRDAKKKDVLERRQCAALRKSKKTAS